MRGVWGSQEGISSLADVCDRRVIPRLSFHTRLHLSLTLASCASHDDVGGDGDDDDDPEGTSSFAAITRLRLVSVAHANRRASAVTSIQVDEKRVRVPVRESLFSISDSCF